MNERSARALAEDDWYRQVDRRLAALETRYAVDEVHREAVERRLSGIEDTLRWLVRLVFGALILGLVAFMLKGGLGMAQGASVGPAACGIGECERHDGEEAASRRIRASGGDIWPQHERDRVVVGFG